MQKETRGRKSIKEEKKRRAITVSLDPETIKLIDRSRGYLGRSATVEKAIQTALGSPA